MQSAPHSANLPAFNVVDLPDTAIQEAKERVRAAIRNASAVFSMKQITVNLAPASLKEEGTLLPMGRLREALGHMPILMRRTRVPTSRTVMGKTFKYSGTLATGITVFFDPPYRQKISPEIIRVIRTEITKRSPVLMGANRQPLVKDSVGETLKLKYNVSPQVMSYVLPLLVDEGFCTVSDRRPYVINLTEVTRS